MPSKHLSYAASGVNIHRGDALVDQIVPIAKKTHRKEVLASIGGFAALSRIPKNYRKPILVTSTDGVGTKVLLAKEMNRFNTVGIDLVAMSVNDILTVGAEPFLFLDYFATGKLNVKQGRDLISGIATGCKQAGCALVGGETAEMPQVYQNGDFDLAGFCVGVVDEDKIVDGTRIREGDVLLGLPSTGAHSNGYSLIRAILKKRKLSLRGSLGKALLTPTKIYVKEVLKALSKVEIRGMAHITGGGIEGNLPRVFPKNLNPCVDKKSFNHNKLFNLLQEMGNVEEGEMFATFNMGIGFVLVLPSRDVVKAKRAFPRAKVIGEVIQGKGESKVVWA